jgi:hypothetical protein
VIDAAGMHRLGAERHIGRQILAQQHRADMQAGARRQRRLQRLQRRLVGEREEDGVVGRIEQQQHAVGLVDLAAAPARQQVARQAVVRRPQRGHARIAQGHAEARAVDHIGQQQRAASTLAHAAGHRWRLCGSMTTQCAPAPCARPAPAPLRALTVPMRGLAGGAQRNIHGRFRINR